MPLPLRPSYPIETERLLLRPYDDADSAHAFAYWSRPDVVRFLYYEAFTEQTWPQRLEVLKARTAVEQEGDVITLAVVPKDLGHAVGDLTLMFHSELHRAVEIGFIVHPDHQRKGYAREGSQALLRLAFEDLGAHRVYGRLDGRNAASAGVLARLGMRREAHLVENEWIKGEWTDEVVYAVLDREWRAATAG